MTSDSFAFTVTVLAAGIAAAVIVQDAVRTRLASRRAYNAWVNGLAPSEPMPTSYEQEWLQRGWDRDNQVEDFELLDAYISDRECEALEEWYGPTRVLPDTPDVLRKLAAL